MTVALSSLFPGSLAMSGLCLHTLMGLPPSQGQLPTGVPTCGAQSLERQNVSYL